MSRPSNKQITAAARILASDWDADGAKAGGVPTSYEEWGAGIADMIIHEPPLESLVEYLGVLEEQLGVAPSTLGERVRWAAQLKAAVLSTAG